VNYFNRLKSGCLLATYNYQRISDNWQRYIASIQDEWQDTHFRV
jgi:hypothetical protein